MKSLSLKLDAAVFEATEEITARLGVSRNRYINNAIAFYNELQQRRSLAKRLAEESQFVRDESMRILEEMEQMEANGGSTI